MRDARPLVLDLVIDDHIIAEVVDDQALVQGVEGGGVQGLAALHHGVGLALELGKHRLAVNGALEVLQVLVQQVETGLGVVLVLEQLLDEQVLIDGGCDLGHEQRVIRVLRRLMLAGAPAVHGVAHLVGQGGNTVQRTAEVQQDIGVGVIAAAGVSTAALATVGINIDPALVVGFLHVLLVVLAQGGNGFQHHLLGGLVGVGLLQVADQRSVDIVEMQLVHAQHLFAQADVTVHGGHVLADSGNQVVVDFHGHVLPCHGHSAGGLVVAGAGLGGGSLDGTGVGGGHGVDVLAVALIEAVEGVLAQDAVGAHLDRHEVGAGDFDFLALGVFGRVKDQVGILQVVVGFGRSLHDLAEAGQQLFLGLGEGVRLAAQQIFQIELVIGHGGVVDDGGQRFLGQGQNLRLGERQRGDEFDVLAVDAGVHALGRFAAGVLIVAHAGIAIEQLDLAVQFGGRVQVGPDGDGIRQLARKSGHALDLGIQVFQGGLPGGIVFKHRLQVPLELRVQFAAVF